MVSKYMQVEQKIIQIKLYNKSSHNILFTCSQ